MTDKRGETPLSGAAKAGNLDFVNLLISANADVNRINMNKYMGEEAETPLMATIVPSYHEEEEKGKNLEVFKRLMLAGADLNLTINGGYGLLHKAAKTGRADILELLLTTYRMNPNVKDKEGKTPLHIAVENENLGIITQLLLAGADPNAKDNRGRNPFFELYEMENAMRDLTFASMEEVKLLKKDIISELRKFGARY